MDDEPGLDDVDRRIRAALTPDEAAVHRALARALHHDGVGAAAPRTRGVGRMMALACAAILIAASVWRWRQGAAPSPPPAFTITGSGSVVVVDSPDGRRWVVGPAPGRRTGGNYVIVLP